MSNYFSGSALTKTTIDNITATIAKRITNVTEFVGVQLSAMYFESANVIANPRTTTNATILKIESAFDENLGINVQTKLNNPMKPKILMSVAEIAKIVVFVNDSKLNAEK